MKRRILTVRGYRVYSTKKVLTIGALTIVLIVAVFVGIVSVSYEKNIPIRGGSIYCEDTAGIILSDNDGSGILGHSDGKNTHRLSKTLSAMSGHQEYERCDRCR